MSNFNYFWEDSTQTLNVNVIESKIEESSMNFIGYFKDHKCGVLKEYSEEDTFNFI